MAQFEIHRGWYPKSTCGKLSAWQNINSLSLIRDKTASVIASQCIHCGLIVPHVNGAIPGEVMEQGCKREDASQAAARIVKEATENH